MQGHGRFIASLITGHLTQWPLYSTLRKNRFRHCEMAWGDEKDNEKDNEKLHNQ